MNILLTGATGFLGTYLLQELSKKLELNIYGVVRKTNKLPLKDNIYAIQCDLHELDIKLLPKNIHTIIHLAKITSNDKITQDVTLSLLEYGKKIKIQKFIFISTALVVDEVYKDSYVEDKRYSEQIIKKSKLPYTILRPSFIFGHDNGYWTNLLKQLKTKKRIYFKGNAHIKFHPVYVKDVVQAIIKTINNNKTNNKTYFVTGVEPIERKRFFEIVRKELKASYKIVSISYFIISIIKLGKLLIPKSMYRKIVEHTYLSEFYPNDQAKKDIAYVPMKYKDAIAETVKEINA